MKLSTILWVIVGLLVLVVAGAGVFLATLDVNQYRPRIAALLADNTGRAVSLDGEMDLALGLTPALTVEDVSIGNTGWATDPDMVSVGRLEAQVALLPLFSGQVQVVRLVLVDPVVSLETDAEGAGNWVFGDGAAPADPPAEPAPAGDDDGGAGAMQLEIQEVRLENGSLIYRDGVTGQTIRVALERVSLTGSGFDDPLNLDIAGAYNDADFTLSGSVGPLTALTAPGAAPWPLDLTANAGGATVTVAGSIDDPAAAKGINLTISANGGQISDLGALAKAVGQNVQVPALGPFAVTATVSGSPEMLVVSGLEAEVGAPEQLHATVTGNIANAMAASGLDLDVALNAPDPARLKDFGVDVPVPIVASASVSDIDGGYALDAIEASLGRSRLMGDIDAVLSGPRPAVKGTLNAPLLDLDELAGGQGGSAGGDATGTPDAASGGGGTVIPDTPLPLDALRMADAALTITADQVILPGGADMADVTLGVNLADGALTVDPLQAALAGGTIGGAVSVTPVGEGAASVDVALTGDQVALGEVAKTFGGSDALQGGPTTLRVDLSGRGATPHAIAGSLNGSILVHTVDGRINNNAVNWAGGDVFTQLGDLVNPFNEREPTTPIQCLVFSMTARDGVLSNDHGLALETDKMVVGGGGAFDLGAERLNLKIAPRPRPGIGLETGFGKIVELFAVTGPFANPSLELDAEKAVATGLRTAASAAGAVATGGLSLLGENLAGNLLGAGEDGEMEPCLVALGEKDPGEISDQPAEAATDGSGGGAIQQQLEGVTEGLSDGAGDAVNDAIGNILGGGGGGGGSGGSTDAAPEGAQEQPSQPQGNVGDAIREGLGGLLGN
ncbi:AsmA family protein [uncultured Rhodospira sp.]|uniref:AsmA family protein n=1 Tax=uncultured Rhodospira sp. TaxID=1936189 RepID=UPI0026277013|nr:AsmA family protein [uncultured Rhodospira sp.]